jgi:hypothetical protein
MTKGRWSNRSSVHIALTVALLVVCVYRLWPRPAESLAEANARAFAALEAGNPDGLFQYISSQELTGMNLTRDTFGKLFREYIEPRLSHQSPEAQPEEPQSPSMYSASKRYVRNDGAFTYLTLQAYYTDDGPRIMPLVTNLILACLGHRSANQQHEPYTTWASAVRKDHSALASAGVSHLYGAFGGPFRAISMDDFERFASKAVARARQASLQRSMQR